MWRSALDVYVGGILGGEVIAMKGGRKVLVGWWVGGVGG